ncbi:MAG: hypothetical protein ACLR2O_07900 [Coprococcus sp.]
MYSKESGNEYNVKFLDDYYPEFDEKFNRQIVYTNYQVQDANGEVIDGYRSNRDSWEKVKDTELADYALGIKISFDKNGEIKIDQVMGTEVTKQEAVLKILTSNLPEKIFEYEDESEIENISPKDMDLLFHDDGSKAECLCYAGISDYFNGGKRGGLYNLDPYIVGRTSGMADSDEERSAYRR